MSKAILCPFYTCKAETTDYCSMHRHLLPAITRVVEHMDPEGICSFNVNVSNLLPMVKMLEEQYRDMKRLERELTSCTAELGRILGGV
jgi:DNA-directed RNA polymerase specialized sigma54-like protein